MPRAATKNTTRVRKSSAEVPRNQTEEPSADLTGRSTSLELALRVLKEFGGKELELGVQEIADRCDVHKSQVSKILSTLAVHNFAVKNPVTGLYKVGPELFVLGSRFIMGSRLARESTPIIEEICQQTGHSVRVAIQVGDSVVYLTSVEGRLLLDSDRRVGALLAWHASAAARVLLAFKDEAEQQRLLDKFGLQPLTPTTNTDRATLLRICADIRETGFTMVRSQSVTGLAAMAAPIFGEGLTCIASLMFGSPEHDLPPEDEPELVQILHASARRLSLRMGAPVYPYGRARTVSRPQPAA